MKIPKNHHWLPTSTTYGAMSRFRKKTG